MIPVSLCEFARTGLFGPLRLGMSRDEIQYSLGYPELWGTEVHRDSATIWRYSDIEFYFTDHELRMIFTDHDSLSNGGETLAIDPWIIRAGLSREQFDSALRAERIEFSITRPTYDPRQRLVTTMSGVQFSFVEERDPDWEDEELGLFSWNQQIVSPR